MDPPPGDKVIETEVKQEQEPSKPPQAPPVVQPTAPVQYMFRGHQPLDSGVADYYIEKGFLADEAAKTAEAEKVEEEVVKETDNVEKKLDKALARLERLETDTKQGQDSVKAEHALTQLRNEIMVLTNEDEFVKAHPKLRDIIGRDAEVEIFLKPQTTAKQAYQKATTKTQAILKYATDTYVTSKAKDSEATKGERSKAVDAILTRDKPTTAEDIKNGRGRKTLQALIKAGRS